jgi:PIN domain nuclease of toxin-antitoxin system
MRLLLDTHAFLWWVTDDERLSPAAKLAVADPDNEVFVSAASAWEIATKQRLGKLDDLPRITERYGELIAADGFQHLAVDHRHAQRAGGYPLEYRDPFDRMLSAQSELERMPLVTRDPAFALFGARTFW